MESVRMLALFVVFVSAVCPVVAQVPNAIHEQCLNAADYSGCVKVNLPGDSSVGGNTTSTIDRFGLPKLDTDRYWGPYFLQWRNSSGADVYYDKKSFRRLLNRGSYGRYVAFNEVVRFFREATAGEPGYTLPITGATTDCYGSAFGSAYGGYGGAFGSANCYSTPGVSVQVPGTAGVPAGPIEITIKNVIDCVDKTRQSGGKGNWLPWGLPKFYSQVCEDESRLPEGESI